MLDLSCRKKDNSYWIVTDRWQKFTDTVLDCHVLDTLAEHCDEFLIHAVDVEGKAQGIETDLAAMLEQLRTAGKNRLDVTIGSGLDLFGGPLSYREVLNLCDRP